MIAWSIIEAKKSGVFDLIIVSTDDPEIADIAKLYGAEVPFLRSEKLSDDFTPTIPVVVDAINKCTDAGLVVDWVCCIYPCVPFLTANDLTETLRLVEGKCDKFVFPVSEYPVPIQWAMRLGLNGVVSFLSPESEAVRSQDLERFYYDAGQFYWGKSSVWLSRENILSSGIGYPIPNSRVVDIDTLDDWKRAELMFLSLDSK